PILAAHVNKAEIDRTLFKPPTTWHAHDYYLRAVASMASFYSSFQAKALYEARRLLEASLSADPAYARAYTTLGLTLAGEHERVLKAFHDRATARSLRNRRPPAEVPSQRYAMPRAVESDLVPWSL